MIARRTFIKGASMAANHGNDPREFHVGQGSRPASAELAVENRAAQAQGAGQCRRLVTCTPYDPGTLFPLPPNPRAAPTNATVEDYRLLQKSGSGQRRGRHLCSPRNYATDNRVTLYAISQLGPNARAGVARRHPGDCGRRAQGIFTPVAFPRGSAFSLADPGSARARHARNGRAAVKNASPISAGTCSSTWTAR